MGSENPCLLCLHKIYLREKRLINNYGARTTFIAVVTKTASNPQTVTLGVLLHENVCITWDSIPFAFSRDHSPISKLLLDHFFHSKGKVNLHISPTYSQQPNTCDVIFRQLIHNFLHAVGTPLILLL